MKITDGRKTVKISVLGKNDVNYEKDYFNADTLKYSFDMDCYLVQDVDYCIEQAAADNGPENVIVYELYTKTAVDVAKNIFDNYSDNDIAPMTAADADRLLTEYDLIGIDPEDVADCFNKYVRNMERYNGTCTDNNTSHSV